MSQTIRRHPRPFRRLAGAALTLALLPAPAGAADAPAAPAADTRGFIYGRVTAKSGTYEGLLRWSEEEVTWGDFFNADKAQRAWERHVPEERRKRKRAIEILGMTVAYSWEDNGGRQLVARFGDIRRIEVGRDQKATVILKSGTRHAVDGGSNDIGGKVTVADRALGKVELAWDGIRAIDFLPVPAGLRPPGRRLWGTVRTRAGEYRGFVQWDQQECLGTDELDGHASGTELAIQMGNIRSIERHSDKSAKVTLADGRVLVLEGTNDVDESTRGLFVDDPRWGRLLVPWGAFVRVDFSAAPDSGPGYGDFRPGRPLRGKVALANGRTLAGRIVWDADESDTSDFLDGDRAGVSYSIPLALVASVLPEKTASTVTLRNGGRIRLEGQADVAEANLGLLLIEKEGAAPRYVPWESIRRVDFDG